MIVDSSDSPNAATPYADLTPASVLDALDAVGMSGDGRLIQLNSYENRVFQAFLENGDAIRAGEGGISPTLSSDLTSVNGTFSARRSRCPRC